MPPRILRLEMQGFKSFAKRTVIPFLPTFNVIVGPNGSGKSNVLDALVFVLGKAGAKGMRAEKTANLLYNGGKRKKPASRAEVTLILDNADRTLPVDADEVAISRILKRDGSSDYLLNGRKVTRAYLSDLLLKAGIHPDGYNIILQGDIHRFVDMSGLERRQILEDIAGLRVYEEKREKAERELERTREKLREADILLAEREARLKELEADREQAVAYKQLEEDILNLRRRLILAQLTRQKHEYAKRLKEEERYKKEEQALEEKLGQLDVERKKLEEQLDRLRKELDEKGEADELRLRKEHDQLRARIIEIETRLRMLDQEEERIQHRIRQLTEEREDLLAKRERLQGYMQEREERLQDVSEEIRLLEEKLQGLREKHGLAEQARLDEELKKLELEEEETQQELFTLKAEQQGLLREKDVLEYQLREVEKQREKVKSLEKSEKVQELGRLKKRLAQIVKEIERILQEDSRLAKKLAGIQQAVRVQEEQRYKLEERLQHARRSLGGSAALDLLRREKLPGVHGLLIELIRIPDEYAEAVETALGSRMFSILVDTLDTAKKAIHILKREKAGMATFIPLDTIKPPAERNLRVLLGKPGVHGLARKLISYDPRYEKAVRYALGDTVIVQDIDTARSVGIGHARYVTLDGSLIETAGSVSGGYRQRQKRLNLSKLHADLERIESELARLREEATRLTQERQGLEERLLALKREKADVEASLVKLEGELSLAREMLIDEDDYAQLKAKRDELDKRLKELEARIMQLTRSAVQLKTRRQQLRQQLSMQENAKVMAEIGAFEEQRQKLIAEKARLEAEIEAARTRLKEEYTAEEKKIQRIIRQHEEELKKLIGERDRLHKELEELRKEEETLAEKLSRVRDEFKSLYEERERLLARLRELEDERYALEEARRKIAVSLNSLSLKLAEAKARIAALHEEWKQTFTEPIPEEEVEADPKKLEARLREAEARLAAFGNVNLKALDLYEETRKQYEELIEKKRKLEEEVESILTLMRELEEKKRDLFLKEFQIINTHFQEFFSRLSRKGRAYLELEKPEDPLEGGVYIKVNITGKKYLDIRSLSGGEKTLTALAFIFAIQEHHPAPFYIMDEVDAALDRKNSEHLAELIKAYSKRAQYIVITHNDTVIMRADAIFGVSMDEDGQSSIISLKLNDALETVKEDQQKGTRVERTARPPTAAAKHAPRKKTRKK